MKRKKYIVGCFFFSPEGSDICSDEMSLRNTILTNVFFILAQIKNAHTIEPSVCNYGKSPLSNDAYNIFLMNHYICTDNDYNDGAWSRFTKTEDPADAVEMTPDSMALHRIETMSSKHKAKLFIFQRQLNAVTYDTNCIVFRVTRVSDCHPGPPILSRYHRPYMLSMNSPLINTSSSKMTTLMGEFCTQQNIKLNYKLICIHGTNSIGLQHHLPLAKIERREASVAFVHRADSNVSTRHSRVCVQSESLNTISFQIDVSSVSLLRRLSFETSWALFLRIAANIMYHASKHTATAFSVNPLYFCGIVECHTLHITTPTESYLTLNLESLSEFLDVKFSDIPHGRSPRWSIVHDTGYHIPKRSYMIPQRFIVNNHDCVCPTPPTSYLNKSYVRSRVQRELTINIMKRLGIDKLRLLDTLLDLLAATVIVYPKHICSVHRNN